MTRKDYQAIAGALHKAAQAGSYEVRDAMSSDPYYRGMCDANARTWEAIADVLAADNPRFNRECFVAACETGDVGRRPKRLTE